MALSAAGGAWGVPGPLFIGIFVPLAVALTALVLHVRRAMPTGEPPKRELDLYEPAFLEGGAEEAMLRPPPATPPATPVADGGSGGGDGGGCGGGGCGGCGG
ncbi:hypothetical protein ACFVH6_34895 [Spirillospora sp. NPDC127200]